MPNRMCIMCKKRKEKEELNRFVLKDDITLLDENKKENTRGIYLCNNIECMKKCIKSIDSGKMKYKIPINQIEFKEILNKLIERMGD